MPTYVCHRLQRDLALRVRSFHNTKRAKVLATWRQEFTRRSAVRQWHHQLEAAADRFLLCKHLLSWHKALTVRVQRWQRSVESVGKSFGAPRAPMGFVTPTERLRLLGIAPATPNAALARASAPATPATPHAGSTMITPASSRHSRTPATAVSTVRSTRSRVTARSPSAMSGGSMQTPSGTVTVHPLHRTHVICDPFCFA